MNVPVDTVLYNNWWHINWKAYFCTVFSNIKTFPIKWLLFGGISEYVCLEHCRLPFSSAHYLVQPSWALLFFSNLYNHAPLCKTVFWNWYWLRCNLLPSASLCLWWCIKSQPLSHSIYMLHSSRSTVLWPWRRKWMQKWVLLSGWMVGTFLFSCRIHLSWLRCSSCGLLTQQTVHCVWRQERRYLYPSNSMSDRQ